MNKVEPGHKYFDWGYSDSELYALYSPILDKIMFLCNDLEHTISLGLLISSKMHLFPIRIDQSHNYSKELIDNSCCYYRTFSDLKNIKKINYPYFRIFARDIVSYKNKITESKEKIDESVTTIRNFLFLSNWTLHQFGNVDLCLKYSQELLPILPNGIFETYYNQKKKCLEQIYLGENFEVASDFIETHIKNNIIQYGPNNIFSLE
jgi:hypothetical protein